MVWRQCRSGWHDDVDTAATMIRNALERVRTPDGVLILTDMFGGTPTNIASTFLGQENVEVVTGVNLPMLIKLAQAQNEHSSGTRERGADGPGKRAEQYLPRQ